jgi:hypothetical protein
VSTTALKINSCISLWIKNFVMALLESSASVRQPQMYVPLITCVLVEAQQCRREYDFLAKSRLLFLEVRFCIVRVMYN